MAAIVEHEVSSQDRLVLRCSLPYGLFTFLCAASVIIWAKSLLATIGLSLRNDAYTHILLILPISSSLIILDWKRHKWKPIASLFEGAILLLAAAVISLGGLRWGRTGIISGDIRLAIEMLGLVIWWIGSFLLCFGARICRHCLFALLFLLWLIPMPEVALNHVVEFLQQKTASFARQLFVLTGIPVAEDGTKLSVPGLTVEVAEECSSIRSSMMLIVSSMLLSYLFLRSFVDRAAVTIAAIPLAIAKNGLRVFIIAGLSAYVDGSFLYGKLHRQGGVLFLAMSLSWILLLIGFFRWMEQKRARRAMRQRSLMPAEAGASDVR